ncbi:MAG: hypothetical protein ABI207_01095 [Crocinitomicaceae bacterium]
MKQLKISILIFILLFLFKPNIAFTQDATKQVISNNISELLKNFSKEDTIKTNSNQIFENQYAIQLQKEVTKDELIILTNNSNPIVRFYAIFFLTQNFNDFPYLNIAKDHLKDTANIQLEKWYFNSEGHSIKKVISEKLNKIFVQLIGCTNYDEYDRNISYKYISYLKKNNIKTVKVDSLLLCEPNNLDYTKQLFQMITKDPIKGCYECIRKRIIQDSNYNAIILLSSYQNTKDIDLITKSVVLGSINDIRTKFIAFPIFQSPKLFNFLELNVDKYFQIDTYLFAVASYKDTNALRVLEKALKKMPDPRTNDRSHLYQAVHQYFTDCYSDLLFRILESDLSPFLPIPNELWSSDKERTYNLLLKILDNDSHSCCGKIRREVIIRRSVQTIQENAPELLDCFNEDILKN